MFRHGECVTNTNPEFIGGRSNHSPLTERGTKQAAQLGRHLLALDVKPAFILCSPAVRTVDTLAIVMDVMWHRGEVIIDDDLQEMSQGDWTGLPRAEMYNESVLEQIKREQLDFKPPGGESMREVGQRGYRAMLNRFDNYTPDAQPEQILVSGHGYVQRCVAAEIEGWSHAQIRAAETPNCSLTKIVRDDAEWRLEYFAEPTS